MRELQLAPEPDAMDWVEVVCGKLGKALIVWLAGPAIGVKVHWLHDRKETVPCEGPECPYCRFQRPIWKGYAPSYLRSRRPVVLEVTLGSVRALPALLRHDLVGFPVRVTRVGDRRNSIVLIKQESEQQWSSPLPWFDVIPAIRRMWRMPD